jgi:hypothetical protein
MFVKTRKVKEETCGRILVKRNTRKRWNKISLVVDEKKLG